MKRSTLWHFIITLFGLAPIVLSAGILGYNLGKQGALLPDYAHVGLVGIGFMFLYVACSRNINWDRLDEQ